MIVQLHYGHLPSKFSNSVKFNYYSLTRFKWSPSVDAVLQRALQSEIYCKHLPSGIGGERMKKEYISECFLPVFCTIPAQTLENAILHCSMWICFGLIDTCTSPWVQVSFTTRQNSVHEVVYKHNYPTHSSSLSHRVLNDVS